MARILAHDIDISLNSKDLTIVNVYGINKDSYSDGSLINIPAYMESDTNAEGENTGGIILVELALKNQTMCHSFNVKSYLYLCFAKHFFMF